MAAAIPDRELQTSPLGGRATRDGITVTVHIYRFAGTDNAWTLEIVDQAGGHTVWDETFSNDQDALDAFEQSVAEEGIGSFENELPLQ